MSGSLVLTAPDDVDVGRAPERIIAGVLPGNRSAGYDAAMEYGQKGRAVVDEVPSFRAFVVERDDRFDGVPGHPGVFVGLGPGNGEPRVAYVGCGLCLATAILEGIYDSPEEAAEAVGEAWDGSV